MNSSSQDSFKTRTELKVNSKTFHFSSLPAFEKKTGKNLSRLPFSIKILLENLLRYEDGVTVTQSDINAVADWNPHANPDREIQFRPARTLLQDFTGVPAVADLAAMRAAVKKLGGDPSKINPLQPADLVIDHSVQVDFFGTEDSLKKNTELEFERNRERYEFLRWGQNAFKNFRVVPPQTGIVHQVNLEYLAHVAMPMDVDGKWWVYPDSLVGTDSHTTMVNGLGVLGWGVGGIEAEASMLGQPITMLIPQVVGFRLKGKLPSHANATDLVLTVTQMLRKKGVVGKFVEFFGPALDHLTLADRATIANMAPEYGATIGIFPVDSQTTDYLTLTSRSPDQVKLVEAYFQAQGLWYSSKQKEPEYSDVLELDLGTVVSSLAGPARPQDRVALTDVKPEFKKALPTLLKDGKPDAKTEVKDPATGKSFTLENGSVVITAITSCTNTSNPYGLISAGLLAKNAVAKGLETKPWVKSSLAPGSKVVTDYLTAAGLIEPLKKLKFNVVGYGCTTCIGNSGPLPDHVSAGISEGNLVVASVLSGNRNFEGRISPQVRANYLASPTLVVAYAIAGNVNIDITKEPLGKDKAGKDIFLKDIWPDSKQIQETVASSVTNQQFKKSYADVFHGGNEWQDIKFPKGELYQWDQKSTYIKQPPFFDSISMEPKPVTDIRGARVLALLKDSVTTDHISPAGNIQDKGPAGTYLQKLGVTKKDFNSYGARRGNHEVMLRGTFANTRLKNFLVPGIEGGVTTHIPSGKQMSIFDASMQYQADKTPLIVIAGKEYGTGSSRDWAAKGTFLLGVRAVIASSFERIHRSNLIGMGVLPLQFEGEKSYEDLGLTGKESFEITGLSAIKPGQKVTVKATLDGGKTKDFTTVCRIDTPNELEYFKHGGILQYVLRQTLGK